MLPPPSTISTTSQHILHLLDQFRYHHCAPSLHKKSPLNSGHTFVVYTANHCTDSWQMDFKERERVKTPSKSNTNEEGEPNYEP